MYLFMTKVWSYIKNDFVSPLFLIVFFVSWTTNAFKLSNFDLGQLQSMYITIKGAFVFEHGINSKYNSPEGVMPKSGEV